MIKYDFFNDNKRTDNQSKRKATEKGLLGIRAGEAPRTHEKLLSVFDVKKRSEQIDDTSVDVRALQPIFGHSSFLPEEIHLTLQVSGHSH